MFHWFQAIKSRSLIRSNSRLNLETLKKHINEPSIGIFNSKLSTRFIQTTKEPENKISNIDTTTIAENLDSI